MMRRLGAPLAGIAVVALLVGVVSGGEAGMGVGLLVMLLAAGVVWWLIRLIDRHRPAPADSWAAGPPAEYRPADAHAPASHRQVARSLGRVEARELASSGSFGAGLGFCILLIVLFGIVWVEDLESEVGQGAALAPIFVHPLAGLVVLGAHRALTRSTRDGVQELYDTCPVGWGTRTVGHLTTAWVPGVTAIAFLSLLWVLVTQQVTVVYGEVGGRDLAAVVGAVVLAAGATALGVALARWLPWPPVPVIAVVLIGFLSIRLGTAGDHITEPIRQLSTWLNEPELEVRFTDPRWGAHLLWLLALTGIVTVLALARDHRRPWIPVAALACAGVAVAAGITATRPMGPDAAARIASLIDDAPAHQRCASAGEVQVCAYPAAFALAEHIVEETQAVSEAAPDGALEGWVIRQGADLDRADLDPAAARLLDPTPSSDRIIPIAMVGHSDADEAARFWVALTAVGVTEEGAGRQVVVLSNQARGVIALWLATRGADADTAAAMTSISGQGSAYSRPWPDACYGGSAPVVWWGADVAAARRLLDAPEAEVLAALHADWDHLTDSSTSTSELLASLGLDPVEENRVTTRTGSC